MIRKISVLISLQERLQAFQTFVNSPAYEKESIKPTFKKTCYRQDRKPYYFSECKPYHSDSHEPQTIIFTTKPSLLSLTTIPLSKSDKPVFIPICYKCGIKEHKSPECPQASTQSLNNAKKNSSSRSQKKDPTVKLLSDQEDFSLALSLLVGLIIDLRAIQWK